MKKVETGRTMTEIISILAIVGILSVSSLWGYETFMRRKKVEEILDVLQQQTIQINAAMQHKDYTNTEELNDFLKTYTVPVAGYTLSFMASPDADGFVSEITDSKGKPIKGKICRELITKMAEQKYTSDVAFTLKDEEMDDGTKEDVVVRLNGQYVDLNSVCGG